MREGPQRGENVSIQSPAKALGTEETGGRAFTRRHVAIDSNAYESIEKRPAMQYPARTISGSHPRGVAF